MEESFPMIGGDGAYSYTKNSQYQKQVSDFAKGMIQEAIVEKLNTEILPSISTTLRLADFGCSVGPNTFFAMQNMIEAVENKCSLLGLDSKNMEFQVFFNDHTANDFNALFASLPLDRKYRAAGVPGSFHGHLFPRASISLAHSSYALHWLSKVPDQGVSPWNQGRIHYTNASRDVVKAYSDQFAKDIGVFLSARAEEIVRGGLMFLIIPGVPDGVCHPAAIILDFLGSSLMDLANEGVIDETEIDAFNIPVYFPTVGEMTKLIEKNGCFSIEKAELTNPSSEFNIRSMITHVRAVAEGIFTKHFGNSIVEKMFAKTLAKTEVISNFMGSDYPNSSQLFVVLKRK